MHISSTAPAPFPWERTLFDPPAVFADHREHEPIRPLLYPDGEIGWLVTTHDLVRQVLGDARFTMTKPARVVGETFILPAGGDSVRAAFSDVMAPMRAGTFINMDAPDHTRFRRALGGRFSPKQVGGLADVIEAIVAERLDAMATSPHPFEFVEGFAVPVALRTICHVLGLPVRPEWHEISVLMEVDPPIDVELLGQYSRFLEAMTADVHALRDQPNDGVLSMLLHSGDFTEEEIIGLGQFLVIAGHHTTSNMMSLGALVLQQDRSHWDAVVADPDSLSATIEELVRYITVLQLAPFTRTATEDVAIGGVLVRAGERVQVSALSANRDAAFFSNPDRFEPGRDTAGHVAFGYGIHQCLGQHLARLELRIVFTRLVERFPDLRPAVPVDELVTYPGWYPGHGVQELPVVWGSDAEGENS
ncbi:cytochrome P450 [Microbacterium abyssi]|uniref:cytochrome P450 n=1 Tax=Microbacterium abyssi TaxID=2782166 RepID=UPI001887163B|nr:cytochrome P450 [Microbacterium sp. A18JL241]